MMIGNPLNRPTAQRPPVSQQTAAGVGMPGRPPQARQTNPQSNPQNPTTNFKRPDLIANKQQLARRKVQQYGGVVSPQRPQISNSGQFSKAGPRIPKVNNVLRGVSRNLREGTKRASNWSGGEKFSSTTNSVLRNSSGDKIGNMQTAVSGRRGGVLRKPVTRTNFSGTSRGADGMVNPIAGSAREGGGLTRTGAAAVGAAGLGGAYGVKASGASDALRERSARRRERDIFKREGTVMDEFISKKKKEGYFANRQPSKGDPSGRRQLYSYLGGPAHSVVAARPGKKLKTAGSQVGHTIGGALAGGAAGGLVGGGLGALTRNRAAMVGGAAAGSQLGSLAGSVAGNVRSTEVSNRKGRYRAEVKKNSNISAFGIEH